MHDRELYEKILGVTTPWSVDEVKLDIAAQEVVVRLSCSAEALVCPECGKTRPGYDSKERKWRHLDTMQMTTTLVASVPRVECEVHGVKQVGVPWAEGRSRFTALFEALVIDWLRVAPISAVAERLDLSWDQVDGIMQRAVRRGLARKEKRLPTAIGVDETSYQKRHEYVTIVNDLGGGVEYVADDRDEESLAAYYKQFSEEERAAVKVVAMDMHAAYISATTEHIPSAQRKIAFDKFHVAQHLGKAVDQVRRAENKELKLAGDNRLKGTRYLWLGNPDAMKNEAKEKLSVLRDQVKRTARAWTLKEAGMELWTIRRPVAARESWMAWYNWAIRSKLEPVKKVARMIKRHLAGIVVAMVQQVTNAKAESTNAIIQRIKYAAHGFRNRARFRTAIYFHCGNLNLYPNGVSR
jgi:transposase